MLLTADSLRIYDKVRLCAINRFLFNGFATIFLYVFLRPALTAWTVEQFCSDSCPLYARYLDILTMRLATLAQKRILFRLK